MKGKLEPSERQKLIDEGISVPFFCIFILFSWCADLDLSYLELSSLHSGKNLKEGLLSLEEDLLKLIDELQQEAQRIPNMTHPDVPIGGEDFSTIRKMVSLSLSLYLFFTRTHAGGRYCSPCSLCIHPHFL